jgi:hypothetical protein
MAAIEHHVLYDDAHADAAICGTTQSIPEDSADLVAGPNERLHVNAGLGAIDKRDSSGQALSAIVKQEESGFIGVA